ncbi:unnamed protein product [Orchesella dallaii]|uniref:Uncharacterized protein n=1 Tax=Orchesella dallaii TaxID=48710 RepID=A0ABP1RUB3_9HEXA
MSRVIVRNESLLNSLMVAESSELRDILSNATEDNILALSDIIANILEGNLEIDSKTHTKLKPYLISLRKFAHSFLTSSPIKNKRKWILKLYKEVTYLILPLFNALGSILVDTLTNTCA